MRFRTTDHMKFLVLMQGSYFLASYKTGYTTAQSLATPLFSGQGYIRYLRMRLPATPSGYVRQVWIGEYEGENGAWTWEETLNTDRPEEDLEFRPDFQMDSSKSYYVMIRILDNNRQEIDSDYPYYDDNGTKVPLGEVNGILGELYYTWGLLKLRVDAKKISNEVDKAFIIDLEPRPADVYKLVVTNDYGESETFNFYVGGYVDNLDASITSRASASIEPTVDSILSELQDSSHGLGAIQDHLDQQDQVSSEIRDSLGTPGSGEGSVHAKLGAYSGDSGDNNNIKDDIASLSVVGATVKDVWSYAPDGSEGNGSTADLLERSTDASEAALSELQDSSHGLGALQQLDQDALDRIGDTAGTTLVDRLVEVMGELQSSTYGLDVLKAALDALQEDIGDPSQSGDTVEALIRSAIAELQDSSHGLTPIKAGVDDNSTALDGINGKLGAPQDDATAGTIWGDINDMQDSLAGAHGKLDSILAHLESSTYGLSVIKSALDQVLTNQGDIDTYGTLTAQSQSIKALLEDASTGLSAIKGQVDAVITVLGSPALGSIALDIADNQSRLIELQSNMDTVLQDLQDIIGSLGDTGTDDIVARLQSISSRVSTLLDSIGTPTIAGASIHTKLGQDYDGVYTEEDGMLKTGHRVIDDLKVIMHTLITAQFPGSGQYLNTQGGYYANNQFYAVGTGPVVNEEGQPLDGVRVSAFMDRDGDGIFETLMARAYTDGSGRWQMALDTGVYLLTFYLPGALLVYEWRVVDPDNSGLEPPDEAPDGGHLPGGGVGIV